MVVSIRVNQNPDKRFTILRATLGFRHFLNGLLTGWMNCPDLRLHSRISGPPLPCIKPPAKMSTVTVPRSEFSPALFGAALPCPIGWVDLERLPADYANPRDLCRWPGRCGLLCFFAALRALIRMGILKNKWLPTSGTNMDAADLALCLFAQRPAVRAQGSAGTFQNERLPTGRTDLLAADLSGLSILVTLFEVSIALPL